MPTGTIDTPYPKQRSGDFEVDRQVYDSLVVGGGPAGLSAAIYLARFNRSVLVIDAGEGRSTSHETNENYLGFPDGIASRELRERGRRQAQRFGADFAEGCVTSLERAGDHLRAIADVCEVEARTVIMATGAVDVLPEIDGVEEYIGRSLYWCITCDGYKTIGKHVLVVGQTDDAAATALQFKNFTQTVSFVTNRPPGESALSQRAHRNLSEGCVPLYEGRIRSVVGESGQMREVRVEDGRRVDLDFMFSQQGSRPNGELAKHLGVRANAEGWIEVDEEQRTNVERVYAAGDVTRPFAHQVVSAAHEGAAAACAANYDLYLPEQRE